MIHARSDGETFGLAIAEFSALNRPVFTSSEHHDSNRARMHLDTLGSRALTYSSEDMLVTRLLDFDREDARSKEWNCYEAFEPEAVMATFERLMLRTPPVSEAERLPAAFAAKQREARAALRLRRDGAFASMIGVAASIECDDLF